MARESLSSPSSASSPSSVRGCCGWDEWLDASLQCLERSQLLRSLRPLRLPAEGRRSVHETTHFVSCNGQDEGLPCDHVEAACSLSSNYFQTYDRPGPWDREAVEMEICDATFMRWMDDSPSTGEEVSDLDAILNHADGVHMEPSHKLLLFSGNDYLGLSSHPTVRRASAKAALEFGMGPRGSPLICGYTHHHRLLESALANLKKTEECLLCPTGFAANMAVLTALASAAPYTPVSTSTKDHTFEKSTIAIFSDLLNHASIIDGIRISQRQANAEVYVYRHKDMDHLNGLLSASRFSRKVVITDSLFSMDGDFAPMVKLVELRKKHGFLLVIDDAHGTLVCGENGGGVAEACHVEDSVDIYIGTLSKAVGCHGGFIATSQRWKKWIESKGRAFVFSTSLPIPVVAASHAAIMVAQEEKWRQQALWERVEQLSYGLRLQFTSPIAPLIIGSPDLALAASRHLLLAGFHVTAIRPPTVPENACRLRITVTAAHTKEDVNALTTAIVAWFKEQGLPLISSVAAASNNLSPLVTWKLETNKTAEAGNPLPAEPTNKFQTLKVHNSKI